jgi:hypothetical protein
MKFPLFTKDFPFFFNYLLIKNLLGFELNISWIIQSDQVSPVKSNFIEWFLNKENSPWIKILVKGLPFKGEVVDTDRDYCSFIIRAVHADSKDQAGCLDSQTDIFTQEILA